MLEEQLYKEDLLQVFQLDPGYASDPGHISCLVLNVFGP